jgi:hypothetical protein
MKSKAALSLFVLGLAVGAGFWALNREHLISITRVPASVLDGNSVGGHDIDNGGFDADGMQIAWGWDLPWVHKEKPQAKVTPQPEPEVPVQPVKPVVPVVKPKPQAPVQDPLGKERFDYLKKRFEAARQKIIKQGKKTDKNFEVHMQAACGRSVSADSRRKLQNIIKQALSNNNQDSKLGAAVRDGGKVYYSGERDLFAFISTGISEASGEWAIDPNIAEPFSDLKRFDDRVHLGQMAGVMFVMQNRMRHDGRDGFRVASTPGAFSGWDSGATSHLPCIIAGAGAGGKAGFSAATLNRSVRAYQYFTHPKTRIGGSFTQKTWYFARGGCPQMQDRPVRSNNPLITFAGDTKATNLYQNLGPGQHHVFCNRSN